MSKQLQHHCILILVILSYLIIGTGLHGDDYSSISAIQEGDLLDFISINSDKFQLFGALNYYLTWWAYYALAYENTIIYDFIKVIVHCLSIYFVFRFFSDYLPRDRAFFASVLFVLFPLHDTTTYWYMTLYYIYVPSMLLYSHHLIRNSLYFPGIVILVIGAMAHYSSPPYIAGLSVIFLFENKIKKAVIFIVPGIFYVMYYFYIKFNLIGVERRISEDLNLAYFLKQVLMQGLSFVESAIGPSFWLKIFYSIESLTLISITAISIILIFAIIRIGDISASSNISKSLSIGLGSVLFFSFIMFALTGLYAHSAFNLGNRTTVYGSLLIAFLLAALLPANIKSIMFIFIIFVGPVFGLSDHWKLWNSNQMIIVENINNNQAMKELETTSTLIVTGNNYSKLGPFAHIEFFSMPWHVNAIFSDVIRHNNVVALSDYTVVDNGYIVDLKFGGRYALTDKLYVYDSEKDLVSGVSASDIPKLIKEQPTIVRHWVQLFSDTWVQYLIVWLSPRLSYLFN